MRRRTWIAGALACALLVPAGCGGDDDSGSAPAGRPATSGGGGAQTAAARGEALFERDGCQGCHSLDGAKRSGPTFQGLAGSTVRLEGGKTAKADDAYLARAISEPDADVADGYPGGLMASAIQGTGVQDDPGEVADLVAFIRTVR